LSGRMKAAFIHAANDIRFEETDVPGIRPDEVLIEVKANGICGSDIHFYEEGRLGPFVVDRPYIPGHESSGVVSEIGSEVKGLKPGDRVVPEPGIPCRRCAICKSGRYNLCRSVYFLSAPPVNGALAEYMVVPYDFAFKIPDEISFEKAALVEPLAVALHSCNRGGLEVGDDVAILGAGPIGLAILMVARAMGAGKVIMVDLLENRLAMAKNLGAAEVMNASSDDVEKGFLELTDGRGPRIVFDAAGSKVTSAMAVDVVGPGGVVVMVGWPGGGRFPYPVERILELELDVRGVRRYANVFPAAISLIAGGRVDAGALITHRFPLERVVEAFQFVAENKDKVIKAVVLNQ